MIKIIIELTEAKDQWEFNCYIKTKIIKKVTTTEVESIAANDLIEDIIGDYGDAELNDK